MQINSQFIHVNSYDSYNKNNKSSEFEEKDNSDKEDKKTQNVNGKELDENEMRAVRELEKTDREVKAHEAAHQAAGGGLAGGASFTYTKGPDNKMYAVAGEVPIKMQNSSNPNEKISNSRQVAAAALAPSNPSPQDYKVAANAIKMEMQARAELMKMKAQEQQNGEKNPFNKNEDNKDFNNKTNQKAINTYKENNNYIDKNIINIAS